MQILLLPARGYGTLLRSMNGPGGDITVLLHKWHQGDGTAVEDLAPLVYDHLHSVAVSYLRRERSDHTLQATALVSEVFIRLLSHKRTSLDSRVHFYTFAARLMRRILVDHARTKAAAKRSDTDRIPLSPALAWVDPRGAEMIDLNDAIAELAVEYPEITQVIDLRIFLGCTSVETAALVERSKATVDREMRFGLAWLYDRLHRDQGANQA